MRKHHKLKIETQYYQDLVEGRKTFVIHKNDRNFEMYDMVELMEVVNGVYTGRCIQSREISYILYGDVSFGLKDGYCIFVLRGPVVEYRTRNI